MKKHFQTNQAMRSMAIIAFVAIIGFSFAACGGDDNGDDGKKDGGTSGGGGSFVGTWTGDGLTVTCTAATWNAVYPGQGSWSGPYTSNGNTANFTETNGNNFGTATISGNTMTVTSTYGTFHLTKNGSGGPGGGTDTGTFLNGKWSATGPNRNFVISGNTWTYYESSPNGYSKGTWSSTVTPAAGTTGTITLTITQFYSSGSWINLPSQYESVKTNTATFTINAAGSQMTITNPNLTTSGVWGTLAGTYVKN